MLYPSTGGEHVIDHGWCFIHHNQPQKHGVVTYTVPPQSSKPLFKLFLMPGICIADVYLFPICGYQSDIKFRLSSSGDEKYQHAQFISFKSSFDARDIS